MTKDKLNKLLTKCSKTGLAECVQACLEAGADVHADDDYALRWAAYYGHTEVVRLLKEHK